MADFRITIIGLWHQGSVAAACFADAGYHVTAADSDPLKIQAFQAGKAPLYEPGLDELILKGIQSGCLTFTSDLAASVQDSDYVLLMFDTPVDENDQVDLKDLYSTVYLLAPHLKNGVVILVTSQVPVGTCDEIIKRIRKTNLPLEFGVGYSPENLRLGNAIELFRHPALPVIGADDPNTLDRIAKLFSIFGVSYDRVNLKTAEMVKHALNAFLAMSICFGNEIGNLCDAVGADGSEVARVLRREPRVGSKAMLFPGLGFSGGTLARDMQALRILGDFFRVETPALDGVWESNQWQNGLVVRKLERIFEELKGIKIAVYGLTYKPDTSTLRRSASLEVIADLVKRGAHVSAYDPKADREELKKQRGFEICENPYEAVKNASVLIIMTPWKEFESLDYDKIRSNMKKAVLFDTNNRFRAADFIQKGFVYIDIGRGRKTEEIK